MLSYNIFFIFSHYNEHTKKEISKVEGATEKNVRIHLDTDNGRQVYEGEVLYEGTEHDFELDAGSGDILEWEKKQHNR